MKKLPIAVHIMPDSTRRAVFANGDFQTLAPVIHTQASKRDDSLTPRPDTRESDERDAWEASNDFPPSYYQTLREEWAEFQGEQAK